MNVREQGARCLWVVEMLCEYKRFSRWEPTTDTALTKAEALALRRENWTPFGGEYRVRQYVAALPRRKGAGK